METYFGTKMSKLGFGLMRLPKNPEGGFDVEQVKKMVDSYMDAGLNYFDTAYVYSGGNSELTIKEALVKRYPRESYYLADKLCAWMGCTDEASAKAEFQVSLERTGAEYFDFYLLHALQADNYKKYDEYHLWDYVKELKAQGLIRHWGFSFHAGPELLEEILTAHPDAEFVQLQLNYADWENPDVQSRAIYEVAKKHNIPIIVMEPVKGGCLANPAASVQEILKAAAPEASCASWAIRYVASLPGVMTVLSGMSDEAQMNDNLSYMKDFAPLTEEEQKVIEAVKDALAKVDSIPCTACSYCTDDCPMSIPIPQIFKARNRQLLWNQVEEGKADYGKLAEAGNVAGACIQCGQCANTCPQQIPVMDRLAECADVFEG